MTGETYSLPMVALRGLTILPEEVRHFDVSREKSLLAIEEAVKNAEDAKKAWIEAALEDGVEIHEPDSLEDYSGQFKLRIPRSLHRSLAEHSQREGISMNQYCVYLLSRNDAVFSK